MDTYIQKPVEISAIEVTWENQDAIRKFMREDFDQNGFQIVYVHNHDDDRWVEQHRNYFGRIGIVGRRNGYIGTQEFSALEGDYLVQARTGGRIEVIKPQEFRKLYEKKVDVEAEADTDVVED